jgi:hypothetical protein
MGVSIAEFLISIGFQVSSGQLAKFNSATSGASSGFNKLSKSAELASVAVFAAVAKISDDLDKLYFVSQRTKAAADNLEAFSYAATQIGVSGNTAAASIENLASKLRRLPGLRGLLRNMGIDSGGDPTQIATQLQAALQKRFPNRQDVQLRYADMFGIDEKLYLQLDHMAEFEKQRNEDAARLGVNLTVATKAANGLWTMLRRIGEMFRLIGDLVVQKGAPNITRIWSQMYDFLRDHASQIASLIEVIVVGISQFLSILARLAIRLAEAINGLVTWYSSLSSVSQGVIKILGALLIAWRVFNAGLLASPIGRIIALLTGFLLLLDDFMTYREHGRAHSLFDWGNISKTIDNMGQSLRAIGITVQEGWQWLIDLVHELQNLTFDGLKTKLDRVMEQGKRAAGISDRTDMEGAPEGSATAGQEVDAQRIAAGLKAGGRSDDDIAAILGNLDKESSLNPAAGKGTAHVGLAQWSPERQAQFKAWGGKNVEDASAAEQAAFIAWDLSPAGHYAAVGRAMAAASGIAAKSNIFAEQYETPATPGTAAMDAEDRHRAARAEYWAGRIQNHPSGVAPLDDHYQEHRGAYDELGRSFQHLIHPGTSPLMPSSPGQSSAAPAGGPTAHIAQSTTVHVHGSGDPAAAGRVVADAQDAINGRLLRNTRGILT